MERLTKGYKKKKKNWKLRQTQNLTYKRNFAIPKWVQITFTQNLHTAC